HLVVPGGNCAIPTPLENPPVEVPATQSWPPERRRPSYQAVGRRRPGAGRGNVWLGSACREGLRRAATSLDVPPQELADPSVDPTDARKATVRRFGRSDRSGQSDLGPIDSNEARNRAVREEGLKRA